MAIHIDRDLCIGSGECVRLAPESFDIADDNIAVLTGNPPDEGLAARVEYSCPSGAISIVADE